MTAPTSQAPAPAEIAVFHPERLVAILGRFKVQYVFIGGIAARLQGFPWLTALAEITPAIDPANFETLATALKHLGARIYTAGTPAGLPFEVSADALARAERWQFATSCGRVDVAFRPAGTKGYAELRARAVRLKLHGDAIAVASLDDLVRMKQAPDAVTSAHELAVLMEVALRQQHSQTAVHFAE